MPGTLRALILISETETHRLRDDNRRLIEENRTTKESNNGFQLTNEQLTRENEDLRNKNQDLEKRLTDLVERRNVDNLKRRERKDEKAKYMELIKKLMINKADPNALHEVRLTAEDDEPQMERSGKRRGDEDKPEPKKKPKLKAFVEFEKQKKAYYTHYIAHPCPYCGPQGMGHHGEHPAYFTRPTETEIVDAKNELQSENQEEKEKAFRVIFAHTQENPSAKQLLDAKYPNMDVDAIIKEDDYVELGAQLAEVLLADATQPPRGAMYASLQESPAPEPTPNPEEQF